MDYRKMLLAATGNIDQVAGIRQIEYTEGRAAGLRAFEVKNGPLRFTVLQDKCLDMEEFSWRGAGFNFLSKPGLQGRNPYDTRGLEAQRSIMGGFFFTAGLENIGAPCTVDGKEYPMHGRIRTTPAEQLQSSSVWEGDSYVMRIAGTMREAELFGENLTLHRSIETRIGEKTVKVTDTITNDAFRPEPVMILYHINIGYPLLSSDTRIYAPVRKVVPRDADATGHEDKWNIMEAPIDNEPEYVFFMEMAYTEDELGIVNVINEELEIGMRMTYTADTLPYFMEWKSLASGDYVLGIEPANSPVLGRAYCRDNGLLKQLEPLDSLTNTLTFSVLEGKRELENARTEVRRILDERGQIETAPASDASIEHGKGI